MIQPSTESLFLIAPTRMLTLVDGTSVLRPTRARKGVIRNRCQQPSTPSTKWRFRRAKGFSYSAVLRLIRPDVAAHATNHGPTEASEGHE